MTYLRRAELTQEEKDYVVYNLLEPTLLNFRARTKMSRVEILRQPDAVAERLDELKQDLGEEYVASMKERIKSMRVTRVQITNTSGNVRKIPDKRGGHSPRSSSVSYQPRFSKSAETDLGRTRQ